VVGVDLRVGEGLGRDVVGVAGGVGVRVWGVAVGEEVCALGFEVVVC
jgi:hypothetical protein